MIIQGFISRSARSLFNHHTNTPFPDIKHVLVRSHVPGRGQENGAGVYVHMVRAGSTSPGQSVQIPAKTSNESWSDPQACNHARQWLILARTHSERFRWSDFHKF